MCCFCWSCVEELFEESVLLMLEKPVEYPYSMHFYDTLFYYHVYHVILFITLQHLTICQSFEERVSKSLLHHTPRNRVSIDRQSTDCAVVHDLEHEAWKFVEAGVLEPLLLVPVRR